jgi:hypothetical protein
LAFLELTFITSGCNLTSTPIDPKLVDQSFITGQPCTAPCWYGIEPDQSTETDVMLKLKELPFVDQTKIKKWNNVGFNNYSNASEIDFVCVSPSEGYCGSIISDNEVVKDIDLTIQYPLPLKSVIDRLGSPEYIFFDPFTPHGEGCRVSLNWPHKRISAISVDRFSSQLCQDLDQGKGFNSGLQITEVEYESKDIALRDECSQSKCITWPGFVNK